jgi:putative ABC transport system ATP-binding protein
MTKIQTVHLHKKYGENIVLKDINISIDQGDFVTIIGPSGSGKSTLLYILGCLETETEGIVYINGNKINDLGEHKKSVIRNQGIGFVFQFFNLVQNLTVEENIILPAVMTGKRVKAVQNDLNKILAAVDLEDKRMAFPSELSGGQQQRVSIARALINKPQIILADEPTGNLDSVSGENIMRLLKEINKDGVTVVNVTHNTKLISYGNRLISILDGSVISDECVS